MRSILLWIVMLLAGGTSMAAQTLYDFKPPFEAMAVTVFGARVSLAGTSEAPRLRLETGHETDWPGCVLPAPEGHWDLSMWTRVELLVKNVGPKRASLFIRVDNPGADGQHHCMQLPIELGPGEKGTLVAPMPHPLLDTAGKPIDFLGMRGSPGGERQGTEFDPAKVTQLLLFVAQPTEDCAFELGPIRAEGEWRSLEPEGGFLPFIDKFGQHIHADWPGKTHSEEELRQRAQVEAKALTKAPGPTDWDEYGGWAAGPQLAPKGFFRVTKYHGKWWLVDPLGHLFWSHGVDCVGSWGDSTPVEDREGWFVDVPPEEGDPRGQFYGPNWCLMGPWAGRNVWSFDFGAANLALKYGDDWQEHFNAVTHQRLRSWGLNTIGNWSQPEVFRQRKTPYVATIYFGGRMLEGSEGYWGKFRDVFDPSFSASIREAMQREVGQSAGDPWCLGYFVDNEIAWGDEASLALAALASPADQPAKRAFAEDLQSKYKTIEALNAQWNTAYPSWEGLLASTSLPDRQKAEADLQAFSSRTAREYFRQIRQEVKAVAPDQLYLGCRFAWANPLAVAAAVDYCDIVSYNLYRHSVADFELPVEADVPLIIGEFHFGSLDRGLFHPGLVEVADQQGRADAYKEYVQGALRHPQFVGCHWFKFRDEHTTGRPLDGENYNVGFVDIADMPYIELVEAVSEVGAELYQYR